MDNKKLKILLVDDDETTREIYADVFRHEGFSVEEAVDGLDGLDKAEKNVPDLILTGIIMPRMDGFGLVDALRKKVATAEVPIFMISHMGREEDRKKADEIGVAEFIVQGMTTPKQVIEKINFYLGGKDYILKFNISDSEALRFQEDFHFPKNFECSKCRGSMALSLINKNSQKGEFAAKIICPNCDRKKK